MHLHVRECIRYALAWQECSPQGVQAWRAAASPVSVHMHGFFIFKAPQHADDWLPAGHATMGRAATEPLLLRSGSAGKGGKGGKLAFVSAPASDAGMDVPMLLGLISIALLTNMTPCAGTQDRWTVLVQRFG